MSLRKLYDQAVTVQTPAVNELDKAAVATVAKAVEIIRNDGDFRARLEKVTPALEFVLHVAPSGARSHIEVKLPMGDVLKAYEGNGGDVTAAANQTVEQIINTMARAQADLRHSLTLQSLVHAGR